MAGGARPRSGAGCSSSPATCCGTSIGAARAGRCSRSRIATCPTAPIPHADLAATETEERLRRGIATLPRLQREVFLLRTQQGTGYAEIAAALGTTPGAARVHYHHAVKRLKELVR